MRQNKKMMSEASSPLLNEIVTKLRDSALGILNTPGLVSNLFSLTSSIERNPPSVEEFRIFLSDAHDVLVKLDSSRRSSMLRAIRFCLISAAHVKLFVADEVQWVIIMSMEQDNENNIMERMQALKIMDKVRQIAPDYYPVSFGRSLVAIANSREDSFRKVCLESLRELALVNPALVATVHGFTSLLDAVIDPINQNESDNVTYTLIFLLNDPITRKILTPCVDLKILLAPYTDLDSDPTELAPKWIAAKRALLIIMKSWVGIVMMTSDELALPMVVKTLTDPKIPSHIQSAILDLISAIFEPVVSKVQYGGRSHKQEPFSLPVRNAVLGLSAPANDFRMLKGVSETELHAKDWAHATRAASISTAGGNIRQSSSASNLFRPRSGTAPSASLTTESSVSSVTSTSSNNSRASSKFTFSSMITAPFRRPSNNKDKTSMIASSNSANNITAPSIGSANNQSASTNDLSQANNNNKKRLSLLSPSSNSTNNINNSNSNYNNDMRTSLPSLEVLQEQDQQAAEGSLPEDFDPVFNLMDNYSALLSCAFLHMELLKSLFALGIEGNVTIARQSRVLMVAYLQILAYVLPEASCAELLTDSALMEMAVHVNSDGHMMNRTAMNKAHKSSQILVDIAEAFSLMPCKQTSGSHISNLTAVAFSSAAGNNSSNSNMKSSLRGVSSSNNANNANNASVNNAINANGFVPLSIKTIYELAEEIRISSLSTISAASHHHYRNAANANDKRLSGRAGSGVSENGSNHYLSPSFASVDILHNLRSTLQPVIDKPDFSRQMDISRVVGKEGKEPFKWDWQTISDMLEYSFSNSNERLAEALRTKWIRRVSGFYRCSTDDKGYFAHLEWEPTNLQYLECACNLYSVLLKDGDSDTGGGIAAQQLQGQQGIGLAFLTNDRRGMLFNQIAAELELLINNASASIMSASSIPNTKQGRASLVASFAQSQQMLQQLQLKSVFRLVSCNITMAREFFTLLGRIIRHPNSKHLLDGTHITQYLIRLSEHRSLDYLSRLVAVSLSLHDGGKLSKNVIQFWAAKKNNSSTELKRYLCNLLRILAQNILSDGSLWSMDAILLMLMNDSDVVSGATTTGNNAGNSSNHRQIICKALVELLHSRSMLRAIINKRPSLHIMLNAPILHAQLIRFLAIPEGIDYFKDQQQSAGGVDWLEMTLQAWQTGGKCAEYVTQVEEKLSLALCQPSSIINDELLLTGLIEPIPIQTPELVKELIARQGSSSHALGSAHAHQSGYVRSKNYNAALVSDLRAFLRMPWNIEAKITGANSSDNGREQRDVNSSNVASPGDYLKVDTFLDASDMSCPLSYESTSDLNRIFKVRGLLLDNRGNVITIPVTSVASVHVTLMAGICPIGKDGLMESYTEQRPPPRRRSTTTNASPTTVNGGNAANNNGGGSGNVGTNRASLVSSGNNTNPSYNNTTSSGNAASSGGGDGSNSTAGDGGNGSDGHDLPVSLGIEQCFQWVSCRPFHRQSTTTSGLNNNNTSIRELGDGRLAVIVPENPVVLIFTRRGPNGSIPGSTTTAATAGANRVARSGSLGGNNMVNYGSSSNKQEGLLYLVEVQYYFRLETGYATFVPMPRHIYGELARSLEGCEQLARRNIIFDAVQRVHQCYDALSRPGRENANGTMDIRANLWALAHIGSTELGLQAILNIDPQFVEWCIDGVCRCAYFSIRGTFFHVLGLLSRTFTGSRKLMQCRWDSAIIGSNSAVTIPHNPAKLFLKLMSSTGHGNTPMHATNASNQDGMRKATLSISRLSGVPVAPMPYLQMMGAIPPPPSLKGLTPFTPSASIAIELEIINLICKMPGVILYRDCKSRLDSIKREYPDLFNSRPLFIDVMRVLDSYSFKLTARRDIAALFTEQAKMKNPPVPPSAVSLSVNSIDGNSHQNSPNMPAIRLAEQ